MGLRLTAAGYCYAPGTAFECCALTGVNLHLEPGELVLALGATGSGKSTLLRVAAGLLAPTTGSVDLDGAAPAPGSEVGLAFQDAESQLFADTVIDDVEFGPRNLGMSAGDARARSRASLEAVGLDPDVFGARSPFTLSGGEARRAALAGVLAMGPRYLLADEPTAGLDAGGRAAVRRAVMGARGNAGVLVVGHTAEEFLGDADRVIILEAGRVSWQGSATDLVRDPTPMRAAGLIPPEVLEVQSLAALKGLSVGPFTLDPEGAADLLVAAGGGTR